MLDVYVALVDTLIFGWLVVTWFYEGHHKKCTVHTVCKQCGATDTEDCHS